MYDLHDFLEPINKAEINDDEGYNDGQLANFISIYETNLPEISDAAIVFIGVPEVRGSGNKNDTHAPNANRKQLIQLQ